jgi:hypothetical protein
MRIRDPCLNAEVITEQPPHVKAHSPDASSGNRTRAQRLFKPEDIIDSAPGMQSVLTPPGPLTRTKKRYHQRKQYYPFFHRKVLFEWSRDVMKRPRFTSVMLKRYICNC